MEGAAAGMDMKANQLARVADAGGSRSEHGSRYWGR
jgi:hypothetical protein